MQDGNWHMTADEDHAKATALVEAAIAEARQADAQAIEHLGGQCMGAYIERARLLAWLAAIHPAVLAPAPDIEDEDGWMILYLTAGGHQLSWHIAPSDLDLFPHVPHVLADDPRAQWDGHTTDEKYARIAGLAAETHRGRQLICTHAHPILSDDPPEYGPCERCGKPFTEPVYLCLGCAQPHQPGQECQTPRCQQELTRFRAEFCTPACTEAHTYQDGCQLATVEEPS
jgi:hypothetical protein